MIYLGKEHNFNKYDNDTVTDYGISYDYGSVMHYSSYAFSKNDEPTIIPIVSNQQLNFANPILNSYLTYASLNTNDRTDCQILRTN